ncbi:MAG: hypothetical protein JW749_12770 [Sedimentisphaerales bacterium]|nr:hypothetical protein [Sedimentisphaerales bacterium]
MTTDIMQLKNKAAVLIASCDKYSDLWGPFFTLFHRFWRDCPLDIYFLSNKFGVDTQVVKNILVGEDVSWSDNLLKGIGRIEQEYVLLFLDDLFLYDYADTNGFLEVLDWILEYRPACVRMNRYVDNFIGSQGPDKSFSSLVGVISKGLPYRVSSVLTFWRADILRDILRGGESIWEFEIYGTQRADARDGFYSVLRNYFPVINGVIGGKWRSAAVKKLEWLGVEIDRGRRQKMTPGQTAMLYLKAKRSLLLNFFAPKHRRKIKDFFSGGRPIAGGLKR